MDNIVEVAVNSGKFPTLVKAVQAAGLVDALSGNGPFTVFAPSEEAFRNVPKATMDELLSDKERLGMLLKYHVISGKYTADDVEKALKNSGSANMKTLHGDEVRIARTGTMRKTITINDAKITSTDIRASNGVIHVIDKVIMPKKFLETPHH